MNIGLARRSALPLLVIALLTTLSVSCRSITPAASTTALPSPNAATAAASPSPARAAPAVSQPAQETERGTSPELSVAVRQVAQRVKPAVVQITNEQVQLDLFNQPFAVPAGVGSGVLYDNEGHILTNNHVVEGAERLLVSLPDGRSMGAKLIGRDPQTDLAVIQISGTNLPNAALGDSGQLQVGDWVVAIGNALALPGGPTVTTGVVSALDRTIQEPGSSSGGQGPFLFDVIQTDAPINPGNSGGPLVNLDGQVVGINTLIAGQAEPGVPAQGIGFAIAISTAKPIADEIVRTGRAIHPYLGISYLPLNPAISAQLGIGERKGVVVAEVAPGSPAARAGLRRGDVITEADGQLLQSDSALAKAINAHKPGDTMTLTVARDSQTISIPVVLGETPAP